MKTVQEVLNSSIEYFTRKGIPRPRRLSEELISAAINAKRMDIYTQFDRPLNQAELDLCRSNLLRLAKREPWQYVRGEVEFYNCKLQITPDVLIPRPETEILVDLVVKQLEKETLQGKILWDVCCGSGCMGISLKKRFPELQVSLVDLSPKALAIARENARRNQVSIDLIQGDLLTPFEGKKCDYIVCNPPYVTEKEHDNLEPEVRDFEPRQALVAGPIGTEFYSRLAIDLKEKIISGGKGWFELGTGQGEGVRSIFQEQGWYHHRFARDWSGHDRFFFLETE